MTTRLAAWRRGTFEALERPKQRDNEVDFRGSPFPLATSTGRLVVLTQQ
jgi:hypothetical protein